jgi:hypothetical protein
MQFRTFFVIPVLMLSGVLFVACPEAMSSSWGEWAKRDPEIPALTSGNIKGLLKEAAGDPEFAKALLDKITASSKGAVSPRKEMLEGSGISAAALASGIDTLILSSAGTLINAAGSDNPDGDAMAKVMEDIFGKAKGAGQKAIADDLVILLQDEDWENPDPAILEHTDTDKLIISAMVLLIAEAQTHSGGTFGDYLDDFADRQASSPGSLTDYERTALCLAGIVADAEGMGDLFGFLKLDNN